ncbi:MAG: phosphatase PAP2 family protein [Pseudodesulfovibrio sp.]
MNQTILKTLLAGAATAVLIAVCYLWLDRPAAEAAHGLDGGWRHLARNISLAADASLFAALLALGFLAGACDALRNGQTRRSRHLLYLCAAVAAAIFVGDGLKDLFGRARPPLLFEKGEYGFLPLAGDYLHSSFPSGHSLRIFASMTALGLILPALRYPALALAATVGAARVVALRHYPSDVLFGAFIGVTAALWGWRILYPYGRRNA